MAESDQHTDQAPVSASPSAPVKGILKKGKKEAKNPKFESGSEQHDKIQWDEMNILMTEHPANKDYGHMKINEPKTPYHENMPDEEEEEAEKLFTDVLSRRVMEATSQEMVSKWEQESSGSEEEGLTDEQKEHKRKFREWRKKHYNEFHAVKRARELIKQEEELERLRQQQQQQQQEEEEDQTMEVDPETGGRTTDV